VIEQALGGGSAGSHPARKLRERDLAAPHDPHEPVGVDPLREPLVHLVQLAELLEQRVEGRSEVLLVHRLIPSAGAAGGRSTSYSLVLE
jgi:hypothetical protein